MDDIIKVIEYLKESGLLISRAGETIENEAKRQKDRFFGLSLGTLGASLLGNLFAGKGVIRAGKEVIRVGQDF